MNAHLAWLYAFLFTEAIEGPIYAAALGGRRRWPRRVAVALGASALTHPVVWFVMPRLIPGSYGAMVAVAELFAVVAEAAYLRAFGLRHALGWSIVANGASLGLGLASRALLGVP